MTSQVNSHDFPEIYQDLGIRVDQLGCVMLDVEPIPVTSVVQRSEEELYHSSHPDRFWIDGAVGERKAHITMLYGLIPSEHLRTHVHTVLEDWDLPSHLEIDRLAVFPSPYHDEDSDYSCIVASIRLTKNLREGHARLELLPHVNTFLEWRAHVTLAYVRTEFLPQWLDALEHSLPRTIAVTGINTGDQHD